jgi:hypothetical protein
MPMLSSDTQAAEQITLVATLSSRIHLCSSTALDSRTGEPEGEPTMADAERRKPTQADG